MPKWIGTATGRFLTYEHEVSHSVLGFDFDILACFATEDLDWVVEKQQWSGLHSIVMVESMREIIGGGKSTERRFSSAV